MDKRRLSVLDLCPVVAGEPASKALERALDLARFVDDLGFYRYWVAEHHSMAGIASSSPEVIIGHLAQVTQRLRVGSGGIMLPNHAPLRIAEAFRTLEAFHPGRIDLGLGRAPGTNTATTIALRGDPARLQADDFPQEFDALQKYLTSHFIPDTPYQDVVAMPTGDGVPELWILGSSDFGARLAAEKGSPFAFAQHFSPLPAQTILQLYRDRFRPSKTLSKPKTIVAIHVICAASDAEAKALALPSDIAFYRYRTTGRSVPLPTLEQALASPLTAGERAQLQTMSFPTLVGSPETLATELFAFQDVTQADEFLITSMIPDASQRKESYRLLSKIFKTV